MSFGPQSNMTRIQPASPNAGGQQGNASWLLPLLQAMQQSRMQRQQQPGAFGANRYMQGGLFGNQQQAPAMPRMPAPSLFAPVQQQPRVPFAPVAPPPAPAMAGGPGLSQDQLVEWARRTPGSPIFNQAFMPDTGGGW